MFYSSRNIALVNGGYLDCMEIKYFLKILLLWNGWSDLKFISRKYSLNTFFKICVRNFDRSRNMALVNGGYLLSTEIKELLKILLFWNCWSDFERTFTGDLLKIAWQNIDFVSVFQYLRKKKGYGPQKFRWAIQGHLGPLVFFFKVQIIYLVTMFLSVLLGNILPNINR